MGNGQGQQPLWAWAQRTAMQEKGDSLERRVERLYKRLGKWRVKRNVLLRDGFGNLSEIDVTFGFLNRYSLLTRWLLKPPRKYVECKAYHPGHLVPLSDVAKFKEVLLLNNISPRRGIFVTTSDYVPRAKTIGIRTMNGKQLRRLERVWPIIVLGKLGLYSVVAGALYVVAEDYALSRSASLQAYYEKNANWAHITWLGRDTQRRLTTAYAELRQWWEEQTK